MSVNSVRKRRNIIYAILAIAGLCLAISGCTSTKDKPEAADYVFANGKVYTVNEKQPWAEAVAVKGNKIVYVGDTETAKGYIGEKTEFVELGGKMMMPGFVESHFHTTLGAAFGQGLWLAHLDRKEDFLVAVKKYADENPDLKLIMGFGWKPYAFPPTGPTRQDLDAISTEKPIFLFDVTAHAAWVNTKTLEMAGVDKNTPDPQPGFSYFARDEAGEATGWLIEVATEFMVLNQIQPVTPEYVEQGLKTWMPRWSAAGLTTTTDLGYVFMGPVEFQRNGSDVLRKVEKDGAMKMRVYTCFYAQPASDAVQDWKTLKEWSPDTRFVRHHILKIGQDGDAATKSIKVYVPFIDDGKHGTSVYKQDKLNQIATEAAGENIHMHFHAMGDASVGEVLTAIEAAKKAHPDTKSRFALAHVYLINPLDFDRFKAVDFAATFAGNWFAPDPSDMDVKNRILGDQRFDAWYPMKTLSDMGVVCSFGSDFPASGAIATYKMLDQIQYGITRQFLSGEGDIFPPTNERISLETALKAATWNGAYSLGLENEIGSIEVGKKADLIVLDENLFDIDVSKIHDAQVLLTMVDGDVMHDAFFGLGDVKAGIRMLGLVKEESEDFDQMVDDLLKNMPANTDFHAHRCAVEIGDAIYKTLKATRSKEK